MKGNESRGMVKYSPYQSLVEQAKYMARMREERKKVEKRLLSQDEALRINEILTRYDGEEVEVDYWEDGRFRSVRGVIYHIDTYARQLWVEDRVIPLVNLQGLRKAAPQDEMPRYVAFED